MPSSWTKCCSVELAVLRCVACMTDRNESTMTTAGDVASTSWTMRFSTSPSPPSQRLLRQVDEPHRRVHLRHVEEVELLLIAEHLERWFAEHGEEERGPIGARHREHDLLHQRGLAGSRRAGNDIERELGHAATQDSIESRDACRQATDRDFIAHVMVSSVCRRRSRRATPRTGDGSSSSPR